MRLSLGFSDVVGRDNMALVVVREAFPTFPPMRALLSQADQPKANPPEQVMFRAVKFPSKYPR